MSFRILNMAPQYLLPSGQVNAGGKLYFYETDLTTPKDTWSDEGLTVINSNPVLMDSAGRSSTDIWGSGEYGVVMTDADDVTIWTRNNVRPDVGAGNVIPALVNGQFLTNDGSILQWQPIRQLPDPSGLNNYSLVSDGTDWLATLLPAAPPAIVETSGSFKIGNTLLQFGHDTYPIPVVDPHHGAVKAVVFPIAFDTCNGVIVTPNKNSIAVNGFKAIPSAEYTTTGFTTEYNTNENTLDPNGEVNVEVPFSWIAFGIKAA